MGESPGEADKKLPDNHKLKTRFWLKPNLMQMHSSYVITDPKGLIYKVQRNKRFFITKKRLFACIFKAFEERLTIKSQV